MFLDDLAPHPARGAALAVGWLERGHAYPTGSVATSFLDALFAACTAKDTRVTRGWHRCTLCERGAPYPIVETWNGRSTSLGHSEIEVTHKRVCYAAPQLVFHYVAHHQYQPPPVFVEAVLHGAFSDHDVYFEVRELIPVDPEIERALQQGLTRRVSVADELAARIELRIARVIVHRRRSSRDALALHVAGRTIDVPWDGTIASGLAILDSFCASHMLVLDEHSATWCLR